MNYYKKLRITAFVCSALLSGCAGNIKRNPDNVVIRDVTSEELKQIPSGPAPTLILTEKESAAFLSQWEDKDEIAKTESNVPLSIQIKIHVFAILWGISNENLCSSYNLTEIRKQKLQYTEIDTEQEGILKFNPISYSEIWSVNTCGKLKKWYVADDKGEFSIHATLPN